MPNVFKYITFLATLAAGSGTFSIAQEAEIKEVPPLIQAVSPQDYCITMMAGFPSDDMLPRYQFFRLTQNLAEDVSPELRDVFVEYGDQNIGANTPILEIIEDMANPVLRQAAPEIVTAYMGQLIQFSDICKTFISGQVDSLRAFNPTFEEGDVVIREDALYLRQILSDSLFRLGANQDVIYGTAVGYYAAALVKTRDDIEYTAFVDDIDDLEALYLDDLDGRLARSNDIINEEVDREVLGDSVALSDSMNKDLKRKAKEERIYTLFRILRQY